MALDEHSSRRFEERLPLMQLRLAYTRAVTIARCA
jgi:hypothetical protein